MVGKQQEAIIRPQLDQSIQEKKSLIKLDESGVRFETLEEIYRFCTLIAKGGFLPKSYTKDKTSEEAISAAFSAVCFGIELGMSPMMSIQNIAVVNGMPSIWGDAQLALVMAKNIMTDFEESFEGDENTDGFAAVCRLKRSGDKQVSETRFSIADAKKAQLWSKGGTWTTHPKRMLRYKARAFALRDKFPDILKGLHSSEEMQGEIIDITPEGPPIKNQNNRVSTAENQNNLDMFFLKIDAIWNSSTKENYYESVQPVTDEARQVLSKEDYLTLTEHIKTRAKEYFKEDQ